jgi:xylulokinase
MPEAALGFDIGTTSVKAGLLWLDEPGPLEVVSRPYPSRRPRPGWVEQESSHWLTAMAACWAELRARHPDLALRSVGLVGQVNSHLLVDADLRPLHPAITWQDTRAAREAAALDASVAERRDILWGGPFTVDASFALSRLAWMAAETPEARTDARWLLQPKDFCLAVLTGEVVTDAISPVGLVGGDGDYIAGVLDLVDGAADLLPPIRPFDAAAGNVVAGNPMELPTEVPVAVGTMDAWGNVFGSGLVRPGRAMEVAGTSEILAVLSRRTVPTPGIISFPPVRGGHLHAGPTQAGGDALDWAARGLGRNVDDVLALAADGLHDPRPLVFLPHLAGERAPYWNPDARGVFLGLTTATEPCHLALAVLEGVALAARQVLEACETAAGGSADELRLSGGGARSHTWNRIKAAAHGRPIGVLETLDSGVHGAALLGMVAAGLAGDLASLADEHVRVAELIEPETGERSRLEALFGVYRDAYAALEPIFPRLADPARNSMQGLT